MFDKYIKVEGNDYERGFAMGKALEQQIKTNYKIQESFYYYTDRYDMMNGLNFVKSIFLM